MNLKSHNSQSFPFLTPARQELAIRKHFVYFLLRFTDWEPTTVPCPNLFLPDHHWSVSDNNHFTFNVNNTSFHKIMFYKKWASVETDLAKKDKLLSLALLEEKLVRMWGISCYEKLVQLNKENLFTYNRAKSFFSFDGLDKEDEYLKARLDFYLEYCEQHNHTIDLNKLRLILLFNANFTHSREQIKAIVEFGIYKSLDENKEGLDFFTEYFSDKISLAKIEVTDAFNQPKYKEMIRKKLATCDTVRFQYPSLELL